MARILVGMCRDNRKHIHIPDNLPTSSGQGEEHFMNYAPLFETGNEIYFVIIESKRLSAKYPKLLIAPMMYKVEDNRLFLIS